MNFNELIIESLDKVKITKIDVMDFDGTLVDSPTPDKGKPAYFAKTGKPWPFEGWWSKPLSLDQSIFDMPVIQSVVNDYNRDSLNPEILMVMMTGRMSRLSNEVKSILDSKGLTFDEYVYNHGGSTIDSKIKSLGQLLVKYPNVDSVEIWEDRQEHIPAFEAWGKAHPELKFKINLVAGNHH